MAQVVQVPLANAQAEGPSTYELVLNNWGNRGAGQDIESAFVVFPRPVAVHGMAIAAGSMVDRCVVESWIGSGTGDPQTLPRYDDRQLGGSIIDKVQEPDLGTTVLSVERPCLTPLLSFPGKPTTGRPPAVGIRLRALASSIFNDTYLPIGAVAPATFGTALAAGVWAQFMPTLRLTLFLTPPVFPPSTHRAPFAVSWEQVFGGAAAEALVKVFPIHGRRRVRCTFRTVSGPGTATIRLTGVVSGQRVPGGTQLIDVDGQPFFNAEIPLGAATPINAAVGEQVTFTIDRPQCTFMLVKVTATVGAVTIVGQFEAIDT